jgi:hypothetical protein
MLIVAISSVSGYLNFRTQKNRLVETMILGADQLPRSITSAIWHAMLDDDRKAAYQIMQLIADKQGVDRIRMFNREGRLVFWTDSQEQFNPSLPSLSNEVCISCHSSGPMRDKPGQDSRVRYTTSPDGVSTRSWLRETQPSIKLAWPTFRRAGMAELADAADSKADASYLISLSK